MHLEQLEEKARLALIQGRDQQAYECLQTMLATDENNDKAYYLLSSLAHKYANYRQELQMLDSAIALQPAIIDYQVYRARALALAGETDKAKMQLDQLGLQTTSQPALIDAIATTYNRLNLYAIACQWFEKLVQVDDANPYSLFNLATCYKFCGQFERAQQAYTKAVELKPDYYKAQAAISQLGHALDPAERVKCLESLRQMQPHLDARLHLAHALSKEYDSMGQFDHAFKILKDAKSAVKTQLDYQFSSDQQRFDAIQQGLINTDDHKPAELSNLFVVGMPRTGTTLLERILSAHANVVSAGELYQFSMAVKQVTGVAERCFAPAPCLAAIQPDQLEKIGQLYQQRTDYFGENGQILLDKLPLNILYAPHILAALPNAIMVCLDRHPLDTIVSNYRQLFSFEDEATRYSLDGRDTARFYLQFRQLMDLLRNHFPQRFYVINYDKLVTEPLDEAKKLFAFCKLEWNDGYLNIELNDAPVATASSVQVRNKISPKSVGQWQRYEQQLSEVKDILVRNDIHF
ncbi:tetratricopeptide repeat-containing sulfotransferase family protein [Neptunicella sp. SCSIO 80796]|uniref:tetratricopeptide repeat-containing sulfotransferase family protein n=1 Tax=Neptunicella plasticusilytica TaxID=3117012 RepID=UPI003A4E1EF4